MIIDRVPCGTVKQRANLTFKPSSHLTSASAFAFFFDLCYQMQTLNMNTTIYCHRTHSWSLMQTQTQKFGVNKA